VSSITTISDLYTEITRLMDGEDPTVSDLSVSSLARMLELAQRRIYRDVRSRWNERPFQAVLVYGNLATLPDDFQEASMVHFGQGPLYPVTEQVIQERPNATGNARLFAHTGADLMFWPPVADGTAVQGRYYATLPDLTDDNLALNRLFQNADDLFIYAALVESAPFFGESDKLPIWEAKYLQIVERLNKRNHRSAYGIGRIVMRPSARICGKGSVPMGSSGDSSVTLLSGDPLVADVAGAADIGVDT